MSKITVWLVRHGESTANKGIITQDIKNISLTYLGQQQAIKIAKEVITEPNLIVVSPLKRTQDTLSPMLKKWPNAPLEIWPIQELTYLSFTKFFNMNITERKAAIKQYWEKADPLYCDGEGAESFEHFVYRLVQFQEKLLEQSGFILIMGHGQFFKAYLLGLQYGFVATQNWMRLFRKEETQHPIRNGEIIKVELEK